MDLHIIGGKMKLYNEVINKLKDMGIEYELVEHAPALTTEQANEFIEGVEGVRTKTMFLTNKKKKNFYLVIMDDSKRMDMDKLKDIFGEKQVKMASENSLFEKMMLPAGVVSPFGLLNNKDKDIKVCIDRNIIDEDRMSFHPNTNEKTIFIKTTDLLVFLEDIGYSVEILDI